MPSPKGRRPWSKRKSRRRKQRTTELLESQEPFEDFARLILQRDTPWPDGRKASRRVAGAVESFLRFDDEILFLSGMPTPRALASLRDNPLAPSLDRIFERLSRCDGRGNDLNALLSDADVEQLWALMKRAHSNLGSLSGWSYPDQELEELSSLALFGRIIELVAEGMTYSRGVFGSDLALDPQSGPLGWVLGLELFLTSLLKVVTTDLRSLVWLAAQPLRRGLDGMCRHYSSVVHVLYHVAQRATGQHDRFYVITITGTPDFATPLDHAWTWLVDRHSATIHTVDLTGADWLLDRGQAETIFNEGFDARRFNNISSYISRMLTTLLTVSSPLRHDDIAEQLEALIDPETIHGQQMLVQIAQQSTLHPEVRKRIIGFLTGSALSKALPNWRLKLETSRLIHVVHQSLGDPDSQHALFDALI